MAWYSSQGFKKAKPFMSWTHVAGLPPRCRHRSGLISWISIEIFLVCTVFLTSAWAQGNRCQNPIDFPCRLNSDICISRIKWQDGKEDCPDGSDEECLAWQYDCKFGKPRCINLFNLMDGSIDCSSGFDEACPAHYFICMDKSDCIDPKKYLDGQMDCRDGSDEPCPAAHFLCHDRSKCVHMDLFQDGKADCADGSDERCTLFQFECLCGEPRCIGAEKFNNGIRDCADGSDDGKWLDNVSLPPDYTCPDGSKPRNSTITVPNPPPGPPMVPCGPDDVNFCSEALAEMCLIIAGAPRCMCQMGHIRPPGSFRCIPVPTVRTPGIPPSVTDEKKRVTLAFKLKQLPVQKTTPATVLTGTCDPNDLFSCPGQNEECIETSGLYACHCQDGFTRNPHNGICVLLVDECSDPNLNLCDPKAICMDNPLSYECLCSPGYIDMSAFPQTNPGRHCLPLVNECEAGKHDCDLDNADCLDLPGSFTCRCKDGFKEMSSNPARRPGRRCVSLEFGCSSTAKMDCHSLAICQLSAEAPGGYVCRCPQGTIDLSPNPLTRPGRQCAQLQKDCGVSSGCDKNAVCESTDFGFRCHCKPGYRDQDPSRPGTNCTPGVNPCLDDTLNDCDPNAECRSRSPGFFECSCPVEFVDLSKDPIRYPGRICQQVVNECSSGTHDCDVTGICIDTPESFECRCRDGYEDISPDANKPGRQCRRASSCSTITCAAEADCQETANGPICSCRFGYADLSHLQGLPFGSVCHKLQNECEQGTHDCSPSADCIDSPDGFLCRCHDSYRDESPDLRRAGRVCVKTFVPDPPECDVNDPLGCDASKLEVCAFVNSTYKCQCPRGIGRLPDGRCKVRDECRDVRLNDCHRNALCIDQAEDFTCQCKSGFADVSPNPTRRPGRICKKRRNECQNKRKYGVDCDTNAACVDTEEFYTCRCLSGYADVSENYNMLPGRRCVEAVNECLEANDCSQNAICEDTKEGYICKCRDGFVDASLNNTHYPGRICIKPKRPEDQGSSQSTLFHLEECDPNQPLCGRGEQCIFDSRTSRHLCQCDSNSIRFEDGTCRLFSACAGNNDCDKNAICSNVFDNFQCQCRPGWLDISIDPVNRPGRLCKELVNECADSSLNDCSPYADCIDTREGFSCVCIDGHIDVSAQFSKPAGRHCHNSSNECSHRSLHTCDDNADCVDQPQGYTCQCAQGFIDVSTSANLPPGRVCTVQTSCPKQATDLMFLVDGSGSIGSFIFRSEVLRFVQEFVELFDIGPDKTRVGVIQYSNQIRHEFDLGQYDTQVGVLRGISEITYLTGLTRTGAAIMHMVQEGFSLRRGARPQSPSVARIAIVITDGRSQDNVTKPAEDARRLGIRVFAIGVTDHVLESELEMISGARDRYFHVHDFTDLDMRLRSLIQKEACPPGPVTPGPGSCKPSTQEGCKRALNEICLERNGRFQCSCPDNFQRHPITGVCGGSVCNPELPTSCPWPAICIRTPFGNYRCACPSGYFRHAQTGFCVTTEIVAQVKCFPDDPNSCPDNEICIRELETLTRCICDRGLERNPKSGKCVVPGSCDPVDKDACDVRKKEQCLPHFSGSYSTCQCPLNYRRHHVTQVCLLDECISGQHDCHPQAKCIDTDGGYICQCGPGYIDISPDPKKFGRNCLQEIDDCARGSHNCSENAICINTDFGFLCTCKPGYVDFSPNPNQFPGIFCKESVNECATGRHTCSPHAECFDTRESYKCFCKPGYVDRDELRNPGRICEKVANDRCEPGNNDCDKHARCIPRGDDEFECVCPSGRYVDKSPNPLSRPGRVCIPIVYECDNPSLNDCDVPSRADCIDTDEGFVCRCKSGYLDISPDPVVRPGRLCQRLVDECVEGSHDCARDGGICEDTADSFTCRCSANYLDVSPEPNTRPGRACKRLINECLQGTHDCSSNADCIDTQDSYICSCLVGYVDVSLDPVTRPGRRCVQLVNECTENRHDCSPNADCIDTTESYRCHCLSDFVDESPDLLNRPGRICRPKQVNECRLGTHDCSPSATCFDRSSGFTCRCVDGYLDESPNKITRPGRICTLRPTIPPPECRIDLATSCNVNLNEVCRLVNGEAKCTCPENYRRNSATNSCTVIDECLFPSLNDCDLNANCINKVDGYTCKCREGFKDLSDNGKPGRRCRPLINECRFDHLNDCSLDADCEDIEEGYRCKCKSGFRDVSPEPSRRPGRICRRILNECADPSRNTCDKNADCIDELQGYACRCRDGYLDISPSPGAPGRQCKLIKNECLNPQDNDCDQIAICTDTLDSFRCECPQDSKDISPNPGLPGRACFKLINECQLGTHNCDKNFGICRDTEDSFTCECPTSFLDRSPNPLTRPGRVCVKLVNECQTDRHTCHQNAECRDLEDGYTCECKDGYVDRSADLNQPGRICSIPEVCPPNHECSAAAVCEPLGGERYQCTCIQGYVDQSPRGLRGRVCVRANDCLNYKTNRCSPNAQCVNMPENGVYLCHCMPGYVDVGSREPGVYCLNSSSPSKPFPFKSHEEEDQAEDDENDIFLAFLLDNECRDPLLNDCSRNSHCIDLKEGYTCECFPNYEDRSPDKKKPGRVCELYRSTQPQKHPCQDPNLNDCSLLGSCRSIGNGQDYTCECPLGYADRSPDPLRKPGRVCVPQAPVCLDPTRNDCHDFAICTEVSDSPGYSCRCRDGYADISPDRSKPGRICRELINECLDARLNDCDRIAVCEDREQGYTCRCPANSLDQSVDAQKPGRSCLALINECQNPQLNNCSRFADCVDHEIGYSCKCRDGYHDDSPALPGRSCSFIINECESSNLHDCDTHANCVDLPGGYTCECQRPYRDESPNRLEAPGRICRFNECSDRRYHDCASNAICQDTDESYVCHCKQDYIDISPDPLHPGRLCKKAEPAPPIIIPSIPKGGIICNLEYCFPALNEVCLGGVRCGCRPGQNRKGPDSPCVDVEQIHLPLYVVRRNEKTLFWSSSYGNSDNPRYIEITDIFNRGIAKAIGFTRLAPYFVTSATNYIAPPRLFNSSWQNGLLFNFSVDVTPGSVTPKDLWNELLTSIIRTDYSVGGTELYINRYQLNIFEKRKPGLPCGNNFCNEELGEICFAGQICGCPAGTGRRSNTDECIDVEGFVLPLWVIRHGLGNLLYNRSYSEPRHPLHQRFVNMFKSGCRQAYESTQLGPNFVYSEVNDIQDPIVVNKTWDYGILYNCTVYFVHSGVRRREDVWFDLIDACVRNNYEIGSSNLFISPYQQNPYSSCFKSDCHPKAWCIERGPNSYTCRCPPEYLDLDPSYQGRKCRPKFGYNECAREIDNDCGENSRCIDLPLQYRCECYPGFVDASPPGALEGSVCVLNFCSDVDYCPQNTTCKNFPTRARCECLAGFMDVRTSVRRASFGLEDVWCMRPEDVNECDLGLTNCSAVAECTDLIRGYRCQCPPGFTDGNQGNPGRVCGARSCALCGGHGDCITDEHTGNLTCQCHLGYGGPKCEELVAGSNVRLILIIIFAILFFLLTLCCLGYLCMKCRCIKGRGLWYREPLFTYRKAAWPWSTLEQSTSSESGADFSGMSSAFGKGSDYYPEMAIPRAKLAKREREERALDASHLATYLDEGVRIPRAHLSSRASSVEREGGGSVVFSDVHQGLPGGPSVRTRDRYAESESTDTDSSSEYTVKEEIERRVITDVKKSEISRTIIADVHGGDATAEFHVYPPVENSSVVVRKGKPKSFWQSKLGGVKKEVGRRWQKIGFDQAQDNRHDSQEQEREEKEIYESSGYPGTVFGAHSEKDRGQSVAEVSVAGIQGHGSEWGTESVVFSQPRGTSEYTERDLESISEESQSSPGSSDDTEEDVYDKKVLVKKSHGWLPNSDGRGGTEKFKKETNTKTVMRETNKY